MFDSVRNIFKIADLKRKIVWTFGLIALVRLIQNIPCPGINPIELEAMFEEISRSGGNAVAQTLNLFSGGALQKLAVGVLGIAPYITASIVMQLVTPIVPKLERLRIEGETGRQQYQQITRYMTIIICIVQGMLLISTMINPQSLGLGNYDLVVVENTNIFTISTVIILTGAAMFIMWLGEQISEKGVGNGASIIITVSIIASVPQAVSALVDKFQTGQYNIIEITLLLALFVACTVFVVALTEGVRKIPVRYARKIIDGDNPTSDMTFLPLKVNHAGVMPIIFAGAVLTFPPLIFGKIGLSFLLPYFAFGSQSYVIIYAVLILLFTFFWVATQFNPIKVADDLKKNSGFIPGYRPGEPTASFLNKTMTMITIGGGLALTLVAIIPVLLLNATETEFVITQFFGGTSLLIIVGVILQTIQQLNVYLVQKNYESFVKGGRLRNREN